MKPKMQIAIQAALFAIWFAAFLWTMHYVTTHDRPKCVYEIPTGTLCSLQ